MDSRGHQRLILGLALLVLGVLLGLWAIRSTDVTHVPPHAGPLTSSENSPAESPLPKVAEAPSAVPASKDNSASAFGTFRGRVIDAVTRSPVRDFEVRFGGLGAPEGTPSGRTFHTSDGRFAWERLPPGHWAFMTTAPGYQRFELNDLRIAKGEATPEIVLPLRRGYTVQGRVYDEDSGAGIAGASVAFRESGVEMFEGNWRNRVSVTSAKDGSFALDGVPRGRVTLEVYAQDYTARELDVTVDDGSMPVEIGLSAGGTIAGRLTAADGVTPVAGAAGLYNLDKGFGGTGRTSKTGEFSFKHLAAGRYQLTGEAEGASASREIVLAENQRLEDITLALGVGRTIRGLVSGLKPEDLKRVGISIFRENALSNPYGEVRLDDRGAYEMRGVQPGQVRVVADVQMRRQLSKTVEVPAASDLTVNFDFPSGARLSGRVTRDGKPVAGVWLSPRPLVEQQIFVYGTSSSRNGAYVIEDLAEGEYRVSVTQYGYRSRVVRVAGDTLLDIDIPPAQVSGLVLEAGGKAPVVGADVVIWSAEASSSRLRTQDRSNDFGQFALTGLEPGEFTLTAYKPGFEMVRKRIAYSAPVSDMTIRLRQETGAEISVHDAASGKPLSLIFANEMIGSSFGLTLRVDLDDDGVGYVPNALAGSTLSFAAEGYAETVIRGWDGQSLHLRLERQRSQ